MSISINSGITSAFGRRDLGMRISSYRQHIAQLGTGSRFTKPSAVPADLAVHLQLQHKINSRAAEGRNLSLASAVAGIAQGTLETAGDITVRLKELSTQAANGTLSDAQRGALNQEYTALRQELDRIAASTEFNGQKLFDGEFSMTLAQPGGDAVSLSLPALSSAALGLAADIATQESAAQALDQSSAAGALLGDAQANVGSFAGQLAANLAALQSRTVSEQEAAARIGDADIAESVAQKTANEIGLRAGVALQAQANINSAAALQLL